MQDDDEQSPHYAAVSLRNGSGQQNQEDPDSDCMYTKVRGRKEPMSKARNQQLMTDSTLCE